ncbi:MAG: transposase [Candidatus Eisenbacteria bacterium]|nr:transposase [Candidatus Eisenbacteria bacterium]
MSGKIFNPLLLLIARLTDPELARSVQFLKAENKILKSKLPRQVRTTPAERRTLLKLAAPLGSAIKALLSIVSHRTFLRWKAAEKGDCAKQKKTDRTPGRKRTPEEIREIVIRLAKENGWGYTRILGELKKLRIKVCRNTVKNILKEGGFDLGPKRGEGTWDEFMKIHRSSLWACDMISQKVWTLTGRVEYFILFFVEVATRRVKILGASAHPNAEWVAQMARNIQMWWDENGLKPSYILKDWDTRFTAQFDGILESIGATVKKVARRSPNLNPHAEAWAGTFRRECLDKFIVLGERHLDYICGQYERYFNSVRPHSGLDNEPVGVMDPAPPEFTEKKNGVVCEAWLGGLLRHYRRAA